MVKARSRDPKLQNQGVRPSSLTRKATMPLEDRLGAALEIRAASRLAAAYYANTSNQVTAWAPQDYGQARMAALGWLISLAEQARGRQEPGGCSGVPQGGREEAARRPGALGLVLPLRDAVR